MVWIPGQTSVGLKLQQEKEDEWERKWKPEWKDMKQIFAGETTQMLGAFCPM